MVDEKKLASAKKVYETVCTLLDDCNKEETDDEYIIDFMVGSDNFTLEFFIIIEKAKQLINLMAFVPIEVIDAKNTEMVIAACVATDNITYGHINYSIFDDNVTFRATQAFENSTIGQGTIVHMINSAFDTVEKYTDILSGINEGTYPLVNFLIKEYGMD